MRSDMGNILDTIADYARERVQHDKEKISAEELADQCAALPYADTNAFLDALSRPGVSFICEVKKASPSKGVISEEFPYLDIAGDYERGGADAISCLTEPKWFLGSDEIFGDVRRSVSLPMIRKDFTIDPYQIYQARLMGADAVLLICGLLDTGTLAEYLELAHSLGLAALVETHDEREIDDAVAVGARIIGVNNRNLKDFSVDFSNAQRLRDKIPDDCVYVAESGVSSPEDAGILASTGADAILMGEVLMRAGNRASMLREMRERANSKPTDNPA